jgi:hypothetical protein
MNKKKFKQKAKHYIYHREKGNEMLQEYQSERVMVVKKDKRKV